MFLMMLGAYCTGWILCNILVGQIVRYIGANHLDRQRAQMAEQVADLVIEKLMAGVDQSLERAAEEIASQVIDKPF